jgi:hydrogenase maturation protease
VRPEKVVVLGVGNLLMSDEGLGVRCVLELERAGGLPAGVRVVEGGTSTHELLEDLEDLDVLVIVDAVAAGQKPGAVLRFEGSQVPAAFSNTFSPHQHGINDLLASLAFLGRAPRRVILLGVQPERLALGMELSSTVEAVMPELKRRVHAEVEAVVRSS